MRRQEALLPMKPVEPIYTIELFPPLSRELLGVLRSLRPADWSAPTVCAPWTVKDVAAHLLGGNLGRLWPRREPAPSRSAYEPDYDALVRMIDDGNALWVQAARRISPEMLIALLELTDQRLYDHFRSLPPDDPAGVAVAWAGESASANWFDIAREYTEKWLHQQHIREAIGQPLLLEPRWLSPVLDTFLRGLPHAYRDMEAADGTAISVQISGEAGGAWTLVRQGREWRLFVGTAQGAACTISMDQDLAWRLFTKGIRPEHAEPNIRIAGNEAFGRRVLSMVSIMG